MEASKKKTVRAAKISQRADGTRADRARRLWWLAGIAVGVLAGWAAGWLILS